MSTYYYSDAQNQPKGPHTLAELRDLARKGVITGATPVIEHGTQNWKTWGEIDSAQRSADIAQAVAGQASQAAGQVQSAFAGLDWGAAFYGLLLVFVQFLILPITIVHKALLDLSVWGRERQIPSSTSDLPVLTFVAVVLRPLAIILYIVLAVIWLIILATHDGAPALYSMDAGYSTGFHAGFFIGSIIGAYFYTIVIALIFDSLSLGIRVANNVRKIADKSDKF